jgi:PAS domain S-box-containing protein
MDNAAATPRAMRRDAAPPARRARRGAWRHNGLVIAALLLPAAILGTGAWGAWHLTWTETERDLRRAADVSAEYVQRSVERLAHIAGTIARAASDVGQPPSAEAIAALRERVLDLLAVRPLVRAVVVHDAAGATLVAVDVASGAAAGPPAGGILEALAQAVPGQIVMGRPYRQGEAMMLAVGVQGPRPSPAVIFVMDADGIGAALGHRADAESDAAGLLRTDGQVLARRPRFAEPLPPIGPERPLMRALAEGQERGNSLGMSPRDDEPVALAYRRISGVPGVVVVVSRRQDDISARWAKVMVPLLLVGLPAVFALMGLALVVRRQQYALETALDGLEQRVVERTASLREGEERMRLAVEAGQLGTWETDLPTRMTTRSPLGLSIVGFPPEMARTSVDDWSVRIHPADRPSVLDRWQRLIEGELANYQVEYRFHRPDGAWRWLVSSGAAVRTDPETGRPLLLAGTMQDITERHDAEERRELLTQEVNHRARNTLAIVQAILRLTRARNPDDFARLVEGRIAALARAQALLAAERWSGAPLAKLITDELAPFGMADVAGCGGDRRFRLDGAAFRVRSEAVQPLGMVFHELATNAAKHGALSVPEGRVSVSWSVEGPGGTLRIRWVETHGPHPGFPARRGVGSRVIEATVMGQLGGTVDRRWPDEGMVCDIVLPLARARAGPH